MVPSRGNVGLRASVTKPRQLPKQQSRRAEPPASRACSRPATPLRPHSLLVREGTLPGQHPPSLRQLLPRQRQPQTSGVLQPGSAEPVGSSTGDKLSPGVCPSWWGGWSDSERAGSTAPGDGAALLVGAASEAQAPTSTHAPHHLSLKGGGHGAPWSCREK